MKKVEELCSEAITSDNSAFCLQDGASVCGLMCHCIPAKPWKGIKPQQVSPQAGEPSDQQRVPVKVIT